GGGLIVERDEYEQVRMDPIASKYLRKYVGGRELIRGVERWCLWLESVAPKDVADSPVLQSRIESVRQFRLASRKQATQESAATPALFQERRQPEVPYVCLPGLVSEGRRFFTASRLPTDVVASNLAFTAPDPDGVLIALVSSSMFISWQRAIGGRLKSDLRFANTLTWNTFPVPGLDGNVRQRIIKAGQGVLDARAQYPDRSLADHYNPLAMDPALVKAHDVLDREVDRAFGAPRKLTSERQRLELLFARYAELTR